MRNDRSDAVGASRPATATDRPPDEDRRPTLLHDVPDGAHPAAPVGLWATLGVLARRWAIVVAGLVVTAALCAAAFGAVKPTYDATGTIVLLPPASSGTATSSPSGTEPAGAAPGNPFLEFGSLSIVAQVLTTVLQGEVAADEVASLGGTGTYEVATTAGNAPIVRIDASGRTPDEALATYRAVATEARDQLQSIQHDQGSPDAQSIRALPLNEPVDAKRNSGSRVRALIAILVLGFGATLMAAFGVESYAQHHRARGASPRGRRHRDALAAESVHRTHDDPRDVMPSAGTDPVDVRDDELLDQLMAAEVEREPARPASRLGLVETGGGAGSGPGAHTSEAVG